MQLTKNFSKSEFESHDGALMPAWVLSNVKEVAKNLQVLRDDLGVAITINSGYRSPEYNRAVNGAVKSQHLLGKGADITAEGFKPKQIFDRIEKLVAQGKMEVGGLHAYKTFTHYDTRGYAARW